MEMTHDIVDLSLSLAGKFDSGAILHRVQGLASSKSFRSLEKMETCAVHFTNF